MSVSFNSKAGEMGYSGLDLIDSDGHWKNQKRRTISERCERPAAVCSVLLILFLLVVILILMAQSSRTSSAHTQAAAGDNTKSENLTLQWIQLQSKVHTLDKEKDALRAERDVVGAERDCLRTERDALKPERDALRAEQDVLKPERDALRAERDALKPERDALRAERDALKPERDALRAERDALKPERDALRAERDALKPERDALRAERDVLKPERDALRNLRDALVAERDVLKPERDALRAERDVLKPERDALRGEKVVCEAERDQLKQDREALTAERTEMLERNHNMSEEIERMKREDNLTMNVYPIRVCPDNWFQFQSSCYYTSPPNNVKRWVNSKKACEDLNGHLVVINSKEENYFVSKFYSQIWIGLSDRDKEAKWTWVDGRPLDGGTHWASGEPNNSDDGEDCAELLRGSGQWNDIPCSKSLSYICEM